MAVVKKGQPVGYYDLVDLTEFEGANPNTMPLEDLKYFMWATEHNTAAGERIARKMEAGRPEAESPAGFIENEKLNELEAALPSILEYQRRVVREFKEANPGLTGADCDRIADYVQKNYDQNIPVSVSQFQAAYSKLKYGGEL